MKIKAPPRPFETDEENLKYLEEIKEEFGIDIKLEEMIPTPSERLIGKRFLNHLW